MARPDPTRAPLTVVVDRHWRGELQDVAASLVAESSGAIRTVGRRRHAARPALLLTSDPPRAGGTAGGPTIRLWWNDALEVQRHRDAVHEDELHVTFFPETAAALAGCGVPVVEVPYAFATPSAPAASWTPRVNFFGEVELGDQRFAAAGLERQRRLDAELDDLAGAVADGARALRDAAAQLEQECAGDPELAHAVVWSLRNRVRYRLVRAVADAFPDRLVLTGSDWRTLGLPARPTSHRRGRRRRAYTRDRVSLDVGSKSSSAPMSPRVAEIIASGGDLAQFDTGTSVPDALPALGSRRAASADALVALLGRQLADDSDAVRAAREELAAQYARLRGQAAGALLDAITDYAGASR